MTDSFAGKTWVNFSENILAGFFPQIFLPNFLIQNYSLDFLQLITSPMLLSLKFGPVHEMMMMTYHSQVHRSGRYSHTWHHISCLLQCIDRWHSGSVPVMSRPTQSHFGAVCQVDNGSFGKLMSSHGRERGKEAERRIPLWLSAKHAKWRGIM